MAAPSSCLIGDFSQPFLLRLNSAKLGLGPAFSVGLNLSRCLLPVLSFNRLGTMMTGVAPLLTYSDLFSRVVHQPWLKDDGKE